MFKNYKNKFTLTTLFTFVAFLIIVLLFSYNYLNPKFTSTSTSVTNYSTSEISSTSKNLIFTGDTGTGENAQFEVADSINNFCEKEKCDSILINGDVIYDSGVKNIHDTQFDTKFEKPYEKINLPIYIAYGNHDYLGCKQCYLDYAKKSSKWKMPSEYYSYTLENIEVFVIDTENFNQTQQIWLEKSLNESFAKWKIVAGHKPLVTYDSEHHNERWSGDSKLLDIICTKADLLISAHSHTLEDNGKINNCNFNQLVSGGGGQTPREIVTHPDYTFNYKGNGFLAINSDDTNLIYRFFDKNNKEVNKNTLEKK